MEGRKPFDSLRFRVIYRATSGPVAGPGQFDDRGVLTLRLIRCVALLALGLAGIAVMTRRRRLGSR